MTSHDRKLLSSAVVLSVVGGFSVVALAASEPVSDDVVAEQRKALAAATDGAGFGPQSPRDIDSTAGTNKRAFEAAPAYTEMNLCNIHFHESAEHKGGDFTKYVGNGDGAGHKTGFAYSGELTAAELAPIGGEIGDKGHGGLALSLIHI